MQASDKKVDDNLESMEISALAENVPVSPSITCGDVNIVDMLYFDPKIFISYDNDNSNLVSGSVTVIDLNTNSPDLMIPDTSIPAPISSKYENGVLTFNGTAVASVYNERISTIHYQFPAEVTALTFNYTVMNEYGVPATCIRTIFRPLPPDGYLLPAIELGAVATNYTLGQEPILLAKDLTIINKIPSPRRAVVRISQNADPIVDYLAVDSARIDAISQSLGMDLSDIKYPQISYSASASQVSIYGATDPSYFEIVLSSVTYQIRSAIRGMPLPAPSIETREFTYTLWDNYGTLCSNYTFELPIVSENSSLVPNNTPPIAISTISDQTISEGTLFNYTIPEDVFYDAEDTELVLSPVGDSSDQELTFANRTFLGYPSVGIHTLGVKATDSHGLYATSNFSLEVKPASVRSKAVFETFFSETWHYAIIVPGALIALGLLYLLYAKTLAAKSATNTTTEDPFAIDLANMLKLDLATRQSSEYKAFITRLSHDLLSKNLNPTTLDHQKRSVLLFSISEAIKEAIPPMATNSYLFYGRNRIDASKLLNTENYHTIQSCIYRKIEKGNNFSSQIPAIPFTP